MPIVVYISIGNSDDKLTQHRWAEFAWAVHSELELLGHFRGEWASDPVSEFQNACWCVEFETAEQASVAKALVAQIGRSYQQDAIAWAEVPATEMV